MFHQHGRTTTMAVQVKSRSLKASPLNRGQFSAELRRQTFQPRVDLYLLFVAVDEDAGDFGPAWLVPSQRFAEAVVPNAGQRLRFSASLSPTAKDQWSQYRLGKNILALRILSELEQLQRNHA